MYLPDPGHIDTAVSRRKRGAEEKDMEGWEEGCEEGGERAKGRCFLIMKKSFDLFMFI